MDATTLPLSPPDAAALDSVLDLLRRLDAGVSDVVARSLGQEIETLLGETPSLGAVAGALTEMRKSRDVNLEGRAKNGDLALHIAAQANLPLLCAVLLKAGAEVDSLNAAQDTPLQLMLTQRHGENYRSLVDGGFDATFETLLQHGADPNAPRASAIKGDTAFHQAAAVCNVGTLQLFLLHGASPHVRTGDGLTPLHSAAFTGNPRAIVPLLEAGAKIDAISDVSYTPKDYAALRGHLAFASLLDAYACLRALDAEVAEPGDSQKARL